MQNSTILLSTSFFGPVYYYAAILKSRCTYIEKHEHFIKQTYRNRCSIMAANGPLHLVVPVENGRKPCQAITSIKIAYHTPWHKNHWKSIVSAYRNSPFFDFYADDFAPFFEKKYHFLFDYNMEIFSVLSSLLNIETEILFTDRFEEVEGNHVNLREKITPKSAISNFDKTYKPVEYTQVFENKFPFVPNLSILDLLFCTGPDAYKYLLKNAETMSW